MDRRTVLAVVLSVAIYYGWLMLRGPDLKEQAEGAEGENPTTQVDPTPAPEPAAITEAPPVPPPSEIPDAQTPFEICDTQSTLSSVGGLSNLTMDHHLGPYDVQPLYMWIWGRITGSVEGSWHPWGAVEPGPEQVLSERARALAVGAGGGPSFQAPTRLAVVRKAPGAVTLAGQTEDGLEITETLTEARTDAGCLIDVKVTWRNTGTATYDKDLWLGVHEIAAVGGGGMTGRYTSTRQPTAVTTDGLSYGGPTGAGCVRAGTKLSDEERQFTLEGAVSWLGISDRYFGMYVMPEDPEAGVAHLSRVGTGEQALDGVHIAYASGLAPGASRTEHLRTYVGPNDMDVLTGIQEDLSKVVDLGWFAFFGYPLLWLLRQLQSVVGNWGWSIVLLTFIVKLVFFPMTQRAYKSMQRMQQIQPELTKIREELKDDPQEMNKRVFAVMQEHKVNPAGGCLPMVVQMPVWVALYNVLLTSTELYHTEFLYLRDLTQPDPYLVLPVTIMVLMFVQQQFNTPANMDPTQQQVMRFMPLFFGLLFFAFPSGLAVYMFVNMVLSNLQQWLIKRGMNSGGDDSPQPAAAAG